MNIIAIIPARMGSSRYPGKPLAPIHGIPMVGHVAFRTAMSKILSDSYVATCDTCIEDYCKSVGLKCVMTADTHTRCSTRTAEALLKIEAATGKRVDIVVMVQGDEPMVLPEMIDAAVEPMIKDPSINVVNLMADMATVKEFEDPNEVKVVVDRNNDALYFSREPIPSRKKGVDKVPMRKQVCIIPFRRDYLLHFNEMEESPLEIIESVDMMRILEHGDKVRMVRFGTSVELCGGTHTSATGNIGFFKILTESAISAGVRRIEAVTGEQAEKIIYAAEDTMRDISEYLHNPQVLQAVKKMFESNETLSKEVEAMRREQVAQWAEKIISSTPERHGVQLIATQTDRTPEFVKDLAYNLRARSPKLVFVQGSVNDGKPMLTVMLGDEITAQGVNAGAVVREAAKLMQGGGGGQAFFATAGGKNPDGLQAAIDKAVELIMAQVK